MLKGDFKSSTQRFLVLFGNRYNQVRRRVFNKIFLVFEIRGFSSTTIVRDCVSGLAVENGSFVKLESGIWLDTNLGYFDKEVDAL